MHRSVSIKNIPLIRLQWISCYDTLGLSNELLQRYCYTVCTVQKIHPFKLKWTILFRVLVIFFKVEDERVRGKECFWIHLRWFIKMSGLTAKSSRQKVQQGPQHNSPQWQYVYNKPKDRKQDYHRSYNHSSTSLVNYQQEFYGFLPISSPVLLPQSTKAYKQSILINCTYYLSAKILMTEATLTN